MTTDKYAPQKRFRKANSKQFNLVCFTGTEQDIIDKLESVPNKSGYIKQLIRDDIARSNK